jgi:hypothetical protein
MLDHDRPPSTHARAGTHAGGARFETRALELGYSMIGEALSAALPSLTYTLNLTRFAP